MMFGYGGGWAVMMVIVMVSFFGLLVWATYALVGSGSQRRSGDGSRSPSVTPREVLDGRLARGEINPDDYKQLVDAMGRDL